MKETGRVTDNNNNVDGGVHATGQQSQIEVAGLWLWKKREMKRKQKVDSHAKGQPVVLLALLLLFCLLFW